MNPLLEGDNRVHLDIHLPLLTVPDLIMESSLV